MGARYTKALPAFLLAFLLAFSGLPLAASGGSQGPAAPARVSLPATRAAAPKSAGKAAADTRTIIVRARSGVDVSGLVGKAKPVHGNYVLRVPAGQTTSEYASELAESGKVAYATPDHISYPLGTYTATPNDPDFAKSTSYNIAADGTYVPYAKSWWTSSHGGLGASASPSFDAIWPHLANDGDTVAYDARATGTQVKVAVIDTGFYSDIPDAGGNIVAGKDEFQSYKGGVYTTDMDVTPAAGGEDADHGTMTAAEISQGSNNAIGGTAAGYDTQVLMYKVQGVWVDGSPANQIVMLDSAIVNAIYDATNDGCKVISMSLGSDFNNPATQTAVNYAWSHGVTVVAATGNDYAGTVLYPAADNHVIGVGSYSANGGGDGTPTRTDFSNWGTGLDILAPGDSLWGPSEATAGSPSYAWWSGTSMATPLVAAAAALTCRLMPNLGPDDVASILQSSARDLGPVGYDTTNGWGALNVAAAYAKMRADYPNLSKPAIGGVEPGGSYPAPKVTLSWPAVPGYQVKYAVSRDGSAVATTTATTIDITGLSVGTHSVTVTASSPRNWSVGSASTTSFTVVSALPSPPAAPTVTYSAATREISWDDSVEGTHTTQFSLDSTASPVDVTGTSRSLSGVADGGHVAYVRMTDGYGQPGEWGTVSFVLDTTPPAAPAVSWSAVGRTVSWTDNEAGTHTTQVALDDPAAAVAVTGTEWALPEDAAYGPHAVLVRMTDTAGNAGSWGRVDFVLVNPEESHAAVLDFTSSPTITLAYAARATLSGSLAGTDGVAVAGAGVVLQRSTDGGGTWSDFAVATTAADGSWTLSFAPGRNELVRATWVGDATHTAGVSGGTVSLLQRVYLSVPGTPSRVTHRHAFTAYSYLKPRFTSGTHPVKVYLYRWEKHGGKYVWYLRKTVSMKAANYSSYTKVSAKTSVPYTGKWKAVAKFAGSSAYTATTSGNRYFTAR